MRLRDAAVVLILVPVLAGCLRSGNSRPSVKSDYRPEPPTYNTRGTAEWRRDEAARQHLALAIRDLEAGDLAAAERAARQALRNARAASDANTVLALVHERRGQREQAGAFFRAAAELAPERGAALNNYGAWLCGNGRAQEALGYFDAAVRDPAYGDQAGALANAGACAIDAHQPGRAEPDLRAALELEPTNVVALDAMVRLLVAQGRDFDARAFSQRRLAAAPATAAALQVAARIEQGLGDSNAAERYLRRLRTEFPSSPHLQPREASSP